MPFLWITKRLEKKVSRLKVEIELRTLENFQIRFSLQDFRIQNSGGGLYANLGLRWMKMLQEYPKLFPIENAFTIANKE